MKRRIGLARTLLEAVRNFQRDKGFDLAATVGFYALLALGPLLYLFGATLDALLASSDTVGFVVRRLGAFLPPGESRNLESLVAELGGGGLVLIAIPGLVWVVTSAFSSLEFAVNVAFGRAPRRKFWHSRLKALLALGLGWLLLGLSLSVTVVAGQVRDRLGLPPAPGSLLHLGSYLTMLAISFGCFVLFLKALPRGRGVGWSAALLGGGISLLLWEAARHLFSRLLLSSPAFGLWTGTLAGVVSIVLWVYTAVAVIVFGAEVTALWNGDRTPTGRPDLETQRTPEAP